MILAPEWILGRRPPLTDPGRQRSSAGDVGAESTKQFGAAIGERVTALLMVRQHLQKAGEVAARMAS